jgi:hypothetical protein
MDNDELVTSREAALLMSKDGGITPVSREWVSNVARRKGWERKQGKGEGRPWLYLRSDILGYVATRKNGRPVKVRL